MPLAYVHAKAMELILQSSPAIAQQIVRQLALATNRPPEEFGVVEGFIRFHTPCVFEWLSPPLQRLLASTAAHDARPLSRHAAYVVASYSVRSSASAQVFTPTVEEALWTSPPEEAAATLRAAHAPGVMKRRHIGMPPLACAIKPGSQRTFAGGGIGGRLDTRVGADADGMVGRLLSAGLAAQLDAAADASTLMTVFDQVAGAGPFLAGKYAGHVAACLGLPDARDGACASVRPGPGSKKELGLYGVPENLYAPVLREMARLLEPADGEARAHIVRAIDDMPAANPALKPAARIVAREAEVPLWMVENIPCEGARALQRSPRRWSICFFFLWRACCVRRRHACVRCAFHAQRS